MDPREFHRGAASMRNTGSGTAIFLIDERYEKRNIQEKLSSWILSKLRLYDSFPQLEEELAYFFEQCQVKANNPDNNSSEIKESDKPDNINRPI